ncbi:hypothetical protein KLP28_08620 [Nocardioidaceae bacterium]|nr:hypothetical protein KLP28_08620 [Nocardioidaceae bacterium]
MNERPAEAPTQLDFVTDGSHDRGRHIVRTVTGSYLLDLTQRRLMRTPTTLTCGTQAMTLTFDVDGRWLPLRELNECEVGKPLRARVLIAGVSQPLRSSPVQCIEATD